MDVQAVFDPINYKIKERLLNAISIILFAIKKHSFMSPYLCCRTEGLRMFETECKNINILLHKQMLPCRERYNYILMEFDSPSLLL